MYLTIAAGSSGFLLFCAQGAVTPNESTTHRDVSNPIGSRLIGPPQNKETLAFPQNRQL